MPGILIISWQSTKKEFITGPSGDGEFSDSAQQVDDAFEDVLFELGEIPRARPHPVVATSPNQSGIGHDVLFPLGFTFQIHLVLCWNAITIDRSHPKRKEEEESARNTFAPRIEEDVDGIWHCVRDGCARCGGLGVDFHLPRAHNDRCRGTHLHFDAKILGFHQFGSPRWRSSVASATFVGHERDGHQSPVARAGVFGVCLWFMITSLFLLTLSMYIYRPQ